MASNIMRYYERAAVRHHSGETLEVFTDTVVAPVAVGAVLGLVASRRQGGLDAGKIPLDASLGILGSASTMFMPMVGHEALRKGIQDASKVMLGVATFRHMEKAHGIHKVAVVGTPAAAAGAAPPVATAPTPVAAAGDEISQDSINLGADPILQAAAKL